MRNIESNYLFANHIIDNNQKFNPEEKFRKLKFSKNSYELNILKIVQISKPFKLSKYLVSSQTSLNTSPISGLCNCVHVETIFLSLKLIL